MNALMEYVRRLVLVVLVLRVTQMLAPEGEMRSYVRFVCGVLLLLAIISPLVGLIPALEGGLDALSGDLSASPSGAGLALAERGRADTRQQAAELYGERLAGQVARELADLPAVRALQLGPEVHIRVQEDSGQIEEMTVRLHAVDRAEARSEEEDVSVEVVRIPRVQIGEGRELPGEEEGAGEVPRELYGEIAGHLASTYGLDEEQIVVLWGERDGR